MKSHIPPKDRKVPTDAYNDDADIYDNAGNALDLLGYLFVKNGDVNIDVTSDDEYESEDNGEE